MHQLLLLQPPSVPECKIGDIQISTLSGSKSSITIHPCLNTFEANVEPESCSSSTVL